MNEKTRPDPVRWPDLAEIPCIFPCIRELHLTETGSRTTASTAKAARDHSRIGVVLVSEGKLDEALQSFQTSLGFAQRIAETDPNNAGWQRDLWVVHNKIGDVLVTQGSFDEALKSYRASLAIRRRLRRGRAPE